MSTGYRQEMRLEQKLLLTPQLRLNLELLQMPLLELEQRIQQEMETNPALEVMDDIQELETATPELDLLPPDVPEEPPSQQSLEEPLAAPPVKEEIEAEPLEALSSSGDFSFDQVEDLLRNEGELPPTFMGDRSESDSEQQFETTGDETVRLRDQLLPQLRTQLSEVELAIAETILDNVDDDGFLICTRDEIAQQMGLSPEQVDPVLCLIGHLESGGIGAANLKEALILQLEVMGYTPDCIEYRLLAECYDALPKKQYELIARCLGVPLERVCAAVETIARLEARPGRKFSSIPTEYVHPDFCVEWRDGQLTFYATDESVPKLRLSGKYREILRNRRAYPKEQVAFARQKFDNAVMLLRGIESRKRTLNRLMQLLLQQQHDFFVNGREYLKPESIKDAGGALGISPSTISRAVQGKCVETPHGHYAMRFFFSSGTDGHARHSVKDKLKRIIDHEDKQNPSSDEDLVVMLAKEGINIKRRTVAKYRSELNIGGCQERRQP